MTGKEYLGQLRRINERINSDMQETAQIRDMAMSLKSSGLEEDFDPNHTTEAPFVKPMEKLWEREQMIADEVTQMIELSNQCRKIIDRMPDRRERLVLRYRYIHGYSWDRIAGEMGYSLRWIYKLHDRAVRSFEKAMAGEKNF